MPPTPPHAFCPWINGEDFVKSEVPGDIWQGTGLQDEAYYAHRNDCSHIVSFAQLGDVTGVQKCIQAGDDVNSVGLDGETALHMAAALGHAEVVRLLLAAKANPEARDSDGSTPLIHCARFCPPILSVSVADLLLGGGASPMITATQDIPLTPLCFAIRSANLHLVRRLLYVTDLDYSAFESRDGTNEHIVEALRLCKRNPQAGDEILDELIRAGMPVRPNDVGRALRVGRWEPFDRVRNAAGLPAEWLREHSTSLLVEALDAPYYPAYPAAAVTLRFITEFGADPTNPHLTEVIRSRPDSAALTDVLKIGAEAGKSGEGP